MNCGCRSVGECGHGMYVVPPSRKGNWMCTRSGVEFYPLDPRVEDVKVEDIAHALSMVCRYGGHCKRFYSVAQHSVLVSRAIQDLRLPDGGDAARWGLLHDATEAYVGDMIRPLKQMMPEFRKVEHGILEVIAVRFGMDLPVPDVVTRYDDVLLATEALALMPRATVEKWRLPEDPDPKIKIRPKGPEDAAREYLWEFEHLFGKNA